MGKYYTVANADEIKPGEIKTLTANDEPILIANWEGTYFATQNLCTHDGGTLSDGTLDNGEVECPRHGGRFSLQTGAATQMPAMFPIRTFPVKIEDGKLLVELD
jgi:nitrite reductase/ring-hydroxylating ferredoxin subunit